MTFCDPVLICVLLNVHRFTKKTSSASHTTRSTIWWLPTARTASCGYGSPELSQHPHLEGPGRPAPACEANPPPHCLPTGRGNIKYVTLYILTAGIFIKQMIICEKWPKERNNTKRKGRADPGRILLGSSWPDKMLN